MRSTLWNVRPFCRLYRLQRASKNLNLLISSRSEHDISASLSFSSHKINVHESNLQDIDRYVLARTDTWLSGLGADLELIQDVKECTKTIAPIAKGADPQSSAIKKIGSLTDLDPGMFLYARLVCDSLEWLSNPDDIRAEVHNLPQGLHEA